MTAMDRRANEASARPLNLNDLADAHHLPREARVSLSQGILSDLRAIDAPTSRDAAGIVRRGSLVFREHLQGRTIRELAAAYVELRMLGAQTGVIDALETIQGVSNPEPPPSLPDDTQAQYRRAYQEQLRRQSCLGCGDDDVLG